MRINAVTKMPAQPPPTNATSNHQAEVIWLSPIHAASPAASGYSLLRNAIAGCGSARVACASGGIRCVQAGVALASALAFRGQ